jgi:D-alanyl-D-alanine carboxypeptidase
LTLALALLSCIGLGGVGIWQKERVYPAIATTAGNTHQTALRWQKSISKALIRKRDRPLAVDSSDGDSTGPLTDELAERPADGPGAAKAAEELALQPEQLLNHRRYDIADTSRLVPLSPDSEILLQPDVQARLEAMLADAKADGVRLGIISGFRTLEDQQYLYFDLKAERGQSARTRAEVSAPPGYSEHHTGYAVDFIDESQPATHLEESFETTAAYQWLVANAPYYNFEMSFPKDNSANIAFEPWHWRYVGNQESLELFYK